MINFELLKDKNEQYANAYELYKNDPYLFIRALKALFFCLIIFIRRNKYETISI
ncbi:conserved hypothetical protein [Bacillus spizizenii TU-B-10]|uniref:Uncharacterized protein n=1 Tax=Bacillus spizizenii (strain DSM 15029 / JCM 12233 / NBRC 101239 / NRRL B-23049 / TU-B-10) TaxID=1052585 RepID=G4NVR0_BACS4|nr:conserved hypothetical protein [Bacillus spizizenii TU-B-10]